MVIIGDVSGKGIPAAMTVSLLVGTFRTLAYYTQRPGEILAAMNHRMIGRNNGGFTTCLVLRAMADGALILANAGHISPYLNSHELEGENCLPLGLVEWWKPAAGLGNFSDSTALSQSARIPLNSLPNLRKASARMTTSPSSL